MLSLITFLPVVGAIVLLFLPKDQLSIIRWTALGIALVTLILSLVAVLMYSQVSLSSPLTGSTFYLTQSVTWISSLGISYSLAIDGISALLVLLTTLLTVVCIAASFSIDRKVKNYMAFMLLLEGGLIGVFLATNLFLFYIFWEVMLIPAYFLVGAWGGERRIYAAFKFVLYTSVGSFLMLAAIIALGYFHQQANGGGYTLDLVTLLNSKLDSGVQMWLLLGFAAAFTVKVPLVPFHSWLPDAYAEAPAPSLPCLRVRWQKLEHTVFCVSAFHFSQVLFRPWHHCLEYWR
jgi:NADH-quinone oxidoreductase subunit M